MDDPAGLKEQLQTFPLWPRYLGECAVDRAIAGIAVSGEEEAVAWEQFCTAHALDDAALAESALLPRFGLPRAGLHRVAIRQWRIETFKRERWGDTLPEYYLQRKAALDRVVYSIVRVREPGVARELYLRIEAGEQTLGEVAACYSEGAERLTLGVIGPVPLGAAAPELARILAAGEPGVLRPPVRIGEWHIIVRVEHRLPLEFDDRTRAALLDELFSQWLDVEMRKALASV